jgi:hypothetical protein
MTPEPTQEQIRVVMSYLGKRNKGKPKRMTPLEHAQRIRAGRISGRARSEAARTRRRRRTSQPSRETEPPNTWATT